VRPGRTRRPLHAAGFTTAFGAHAVAANLGVYTASRHGSLLTLGILLALYDGAEVILKPVFGALADRIGGKPVLIGGLLAFAAASGGFLLAGSPAALFAARLGQGAAAAAFSPAASMLVARLAALGLALAGWAVLAVPAAPAAAQAPPDHRRPHPPPVSARVPRPGRRAGRSHRRPPGRRRVPAGTRP